MATIEEARYRPCSPKTANPLSSRYAIRNQRNFVKITLPQGATHLSASLAGKPVRPGSAPDGNPLLLRESRAGEDASSSLEIVYLLPRHILDRQQGRLKLHFPRQTCPSRAPGLSGFFHRFSVSSEPGSSTRSPRLPVRLSWSRPSPNRPWTRLSRFRTPRSL